MSNGDPVPDVVSTEGQQYPTLLQRYNSARLTAFLSIFAVFSIGPGVAFAFGVKGFDWYPQYCFGVATASWGIIQFIFGVRSGEKKGES